MLQFKPIAIADQKLLSTFLHKFDCQLLNYSFAVLFLYRNVCRFQYAISDNFLLIKATHNNEDYFMFPMGDGDMNAVLDTITSETLSKGIKPVRFYQFCNDIAPVLLLWAEEFCNKTGMQFRTDSVRSDFEYIYLSKKLALLEGHFFKPKRNQINSFTKNNLWNWSCITKENIEEVQRFNSLWDSLKDCEEHPTLEAENIALKDAFSYFFELNLQGVLLKVEDKIVAFSIGFPLNKETFLVLFEKADRNCKGTYTMINKLFAQEISKNFTFINRAEDAGEEGLRKAKLSYQQEYLIEVNELEIY